MYDRKAKAGKREADDFSEQEQGLKFALRRAISISIRTQLKVFRNKDNWTDFRCMITPFLGLQNVEAFKVDAYKKADIIKLLKETF